MTPEFDELVGEEGTAEERERLRHVHDLLVAAGPPPELSPRLESPPSTGGEVHYLPRRRRGALLLIAAAVVAVTFGIGYIVGNRGNSVQGNQVVAMHGVGPRSTATASVRIGQHDEYGNTQLLLSVRGLHKLPRGSWYVLYLTKGKKREPCGTFNADGGETSIRLSVPYDLQRYTGWVITARLHGKESRVLLRTSAI
jgi:hypothetical protein